MITWQVCCVNCKHLFATAGEFSSCPKCGQWCQAHDYRTEGLSDAEKLALIEALCRRHCNPSVVTSTHVLSSKIIAIIESDDR